MVRDLTKGSIFKQIILFTVPLIFGNIFQLTYNAVDSIIVGRFAGTEALAAVGTADPVMNLLILGITGLCIGSSVLMSNYFGEKNFEKLKKEFAIILTLGIGLSIVVLILGLIFVKEIFYLMNVHSSIINLSISYMRIIFIGMPFTCLYNIYAAAMRSVGDTKTAVNFLAFASVLNAALDILFIVVLKMNVVGAALATVIAQAVSSLLCVYFVYKKVSILHVKRGDFKLQSDMVVKTVRYGGMTALQQCSQPIGKLLIQCVINTLGVSSMAAFNAVGKIEDFALVPGRSISNAMMTFTAQNDGANLQNRVRSGLKKGIILEFSYWAFICVVILVCQQKMLGLFSSDSMTISEGVKYFSVIAFFYWLPGLTNAMQGFFRGMGNMRITLFGTLTQISMRVVATCILVPKMGISGVSFSCIFGWVAMLFLEIPYYFHFMKSKQNKIEKC